MAIEKLSVEKIVDLAISSVSRHISKKPETVISIDSADDEWLVTVEALERKAVPDTQDLLSRYEIKLGMDGEIFGWRQKMIRKRSDRMMSAEEEWIVSG